VEEYVSLTVRALLEDGVRVQLEAFRLGFEEVREISHFSPPFFLSHFLDFF
jgi:hypothetical protein